MMNMQLFLHYLADSSFLGLNSPTAGTCFEAADGCKDKLIGGAISKVIGNVVGDLFVIAAFVAAIFVIYSGIMYIVSMGDANKMSGAKQGLQRALMGFFISLCANVIVNVILTTTGSTSGRPGSTADLGALIGQSLQLAGILGVAMTIISGILYEISLGDESRVKKAKNALISSLVGTAIAFLGTAIINLVGQAKPTGTTLANVAGPAVGLLMWVAGIIAVVGIIMAGIMYATASGDESKVTRAKRFIRYAIVGLVIAILSWALQTFALKAVGGG